MRKQSPFIFLLLFVLLLAASCKKSANENYIAETVTKKQGIRNLLLNTDIKASLQKALKEHAIKLTGDGDPNTMRASFVTPFLTSDGFGIINPSEQLAFFSAEMGEKDFYRQNPDGTVSVHITSKNALAEYFDFVSNEYASGNSAQMSMIYTGKVIEIDLGGGFIIKIIDYLSANPNAVVWNGSGKVQFNSEGPSSTLKAHLTANPGWVQVKATFSLD
jgi:hypothetical protein